MLLMSMFTMVIIIAQTRIAINGVQYTLSGAYASVYRLELGNAATTITIPSSIEYNGNTYIVNYVGNEAFNAKYTENRNVSNIVLPNTIKGIGSYAFANIVSNNSTRYENKIQSVILEEGITRIGSHAFDNSTISNVKLTKGIKEIGDYAFANTSISSMELADGVEYIGDYAFANSSISNLRLVEGINYIGKGAFINTRITSLVVPSTIRGFYYIAILSYFLII